MDEAFFFDPMAFGVRVRQLRQERALSLLALANDAGNNYNTTDYVQDLSRRRETRYIKLTLMYMFGKMDSGLFKKLKQQKKEGGDDQGGMGGGMGG